MTVVNKKKALVSLLGIAAVSGSRVFADGYAAGWSDWSTTRSDVNGEQSRTEYRYADVSSWRACNANYTSAPADGYYRSGRYDPYNCQTCTRTGCTSSGCTGWGCTDYGCTGSHYRSDYSSDYCCWSCDHGCTGYGCTAYGCTGYGCTSYANTGSCGATANCYAPPSAWGGWSAWSTTVYTKSTSRKVETRTVYSYPLSCTVMFDANGGSGTMANQEVSYTTNTALSTCTFTRSGYTFAGWMKNSTDAVAEFSNGQAVKCTDLGIAAGGSGTIYAKWKENLPAPTVNVSPEGIVTWNSINHATSYSISIDGSTWVDNVTSGYDFNSTITASKGERTVRVRANGDNDYQSSIGSKSVNVFSVSLSGDAGIASVETGGSSGVTTTKNYIQNRNVQVGATPKSGYSFKKWENGE